MAIAVIGPGWRITIPVEIRRKLGLVPGDRVEFLNVDEGVQIRKYEPSDLSIRKDSDCLTPKAD